MKKTTNAQKKLWNEAVKATIREAKKWDGLIPDEDEGDRDFMAEQMAKKLLYKNIK